MTILKESIIAGDSTGYTLNRASAYYRTRSGKQYRGWVKGSYTVSTQSQFILVAQSSGDRASMMSECWFPCVTACGRVGDTIGCSWVASALIVAVTVRDLVSSIRWDKRLVAPDWKVHTDLVAQAHWDGLNGQRWKTETVHSVIKRKLGDYIRSILKDRQSRAPLIKAVVYNRHHQPAAAPAMIATEHIVSIRRESNESYQQSTSFVFHGRYSYLCIKCLQLCTDQHSYACPCPNFSVF